MDWLGQNWIWVVVAIAVFAMMARRRSGHPQHAHGSEAGSERMDGHEHGAPSPGTPAEATDPVSGKSLRADHALSSVYAGRVFYFESPDTRQRFEADPERFARNATGVPLAGGAAPSHRHHGC
jgi:YHS domain-containing protein